MRYLADQKWISQSPELLNLEQSMSANSIAKELKASLNFDFEKTYRLGLYFEQLWFHLISNSKDFELTHKNLQVIIDKHTYGEFDSIVGSGKRSIHCELAVKFYLQVGHGDKLSDWVGPNLKDRFDDKYKRLFEHQLGLSDKNDIRQWLIEKKIKIDEKRIFCKGRLFYPYQKFISEQFEFANEVASGHLKGFWIHYKELEEVLTETNYEWYQLPRFYWLAEVEEQDENLLSVEKDFDGFSLQKIVALKDGIEVMRGFVVNDDWLHKARQRILD